MGRRVPHSGSNTSPFESPMPTPWLAIAGDRGALAPKPGARLASEGPFFPPRAFELDCWLRPPQGPRCRSELSRSVLGDGDGSRGQRRAGGKRVAPRRVEPLASVREHHDRQKRSNQGESTRNSKGDVFEPERATLFPTAEPGCRRHDRPRRILRVSVREGPSSQRGSTGAGSTDSVRTGLPSCSSASMTTRTKRLTTLTRRKVAGSLRS